MTEVSPTTPPSIRLRLPSEVAVELHCSERHLRKLARDLGACSIVGKVMLLSDADVATILEASRPQPRIRTSPAETGALPEGDYETLRAMLVKNMASPTRKRR